MKKLVLTLLISSFMITAAPAQKYESSGTLKIKKWSVAMYLGWKIGGPSKQIEKAMDVYGFNIPPAILIENGDFRLYFTLSIHEGIEWLVYG